MDDQLQYYDPDTDEGEEEELAEPQISNGGSWGPDKDQESTVRGISPSKEETESMIDSTFVAEDLGLSVNAVSIRNTHSKVSVGNIPKMQQPEERRNTMFSGVYTFYAGEMYSEVIGHDGLRYWQLSGLSEYGPQQFHPDGTPWVEVPDYYKWRLGANGLPLPIFNGAKIKCSRKSRRIKKGISTYVNSSTQSSATSKGAVHKPAHKHKHRHQDKVFDFFFDANGEILKVSGDKLSYHWHLFDEDNEPVEWKDVNAEPGKTIFRHDGKIFDLMGVEKNFKWMYVHQDGSFLDPGYEADTPEVVFPADGSIGMRLLTNPDGSLFISKFGKPVLVVEDELDIYGPGGNKILVYNQEDEYTDPDGKELKIGHHVLGPDGKPIMYVESLEENSKRLGVEVPSVNYSGFNVKLDKWGNITAGNPIILDPNGPPVLLVKYTSDRHSFRKDKNATVKPFIEKSSYVPFWIIDPDGKLIVLHDKEGKLWDRHNKIYPPTGSGKEPNGDQYDYYIFSGTDRPCEKQSICFHPEILDTEDEDDENENEVQDGHRNLDIDQIKKMLKYHSDLYGKTNTTLFRCFQFPKCLKDGSYQSYMRSLCLDSSIVFKSQFDIQDEQKDKPHH